MDLLTMPKTRKIGGGVILGLILYVVYWVASVGIFKQTVLGVLAIELTILGCFVIGSCADFIRKRYSNSKWIRSNLYVPIVYSVLFISGCLALVGLLFGNLYAIAYSGLFGVISMIALLAGRE